jgi:hypothetical protein
MLRRSVPAVAGVHRVEEMLRLVDALGIARVPELVCPESAAPAVPGTPYAVIHAAPMFRYKRWTQEGWRELAAALRKRGLAIMATGGPDDTERRERLPDHCALWADRSAAVGTVADGRIARHVAGRGQDAAARQRLAGAESAAVPAVPKGRLRPSHRELQPLPR